MLALNQKFSDARSIKVLVVPIGDNSLFDRQFEIVSRRRNVPMYELNRPSAEARVPNSPFKNLNWESGSLLFDYLRYDRVSSGQGDLDSFQCNRRYLHVIGLINYPELEGSKYRLEEDMDYYTRRYPNVILRRYFVFNMFNHPSSNSWTIPSIPNDPNAIVVFPPDGECEGGNSMIDIHLQEVMAGVALKIVLSLEAQAAACEESRVRSSSQNRTPPGMNLFTTYDEMEEGAIEGSGAAGISYSNASSKMKRRIGGRLRKITADLCLQVGSPLDALDHYIGTIAECKSQGDSMWLAGAYEGFVASMLWCMDLKMALEDVLGRELRTLMQSGLNVSGAVVKLAEERCLEALGVYARNIAFAALEVECSLKLARMYEEADAASVTDREQKVMEFLLRAVSVPGLNRQRQMECTLEAAFVCSRMNLKRKYAFFLFLAAQFAADSENATVTHLLMKCCLEQYGINFNEDVYHAVIANDGSDSLLMSNPSSSCLYQSQQHLLKQDGQVVRCNLSWASMRRLLYAQCAYFGKEAGDTASAARCLAGMLRLIAEADVQWRKSTVQWLPYGFKPEDLPRLLLTCNNVNLSGITSSQSMNESTLVSSRFGSPTGAGPLTIKAALERNTSTSSSEHTSPANVRSPTISSLNSSHTMASFKKIYSKGNYRQLHAKMRSAGGRIADLHDNFTSMIEKNQVFDFSLSGHDDRDREVSDTASEAGSVRGLVPAFLGESNLSKSQVVKRKIALPKLDGFVSSLTFRSTQTNTPKILPRSASIASVVGAISGLGISNEASSSDPFPPSTTGSALSSESAAGPSSAYNASPSGSMAGSIFSFGNSVTIPNTVTSTLLDTPDVAKVAMAAAGLLDDSGNPNAGALTPATNCMIRNWIGGSGFGNSMSLEKLKPLQDVCVKRLEMFCEDVPPSCPVYFGEMPLLVSMKPLALPENNVPLLAPPVAASLKDVGPKPADSDSALYYDPFMAKRDKKLKDKSKGPQEIMWEQGTVCKVLVLFTNPLCVPMRLYNVAVILQQVEDGTAPRSGKCYEITPENVDIPSIIEGGSCYQTVLSVKPIKTCKLKLIGVRFFIRNAMHVSLIDDEGKGIRKSKEIVAPWTYPRQAHDIKTGKSKVGENKSVSSENQKTSMIIQVAGKAASVRMTLSWSQKEGTCTVIKKSLPSVVADKSLANASILPLSDGECRREIISIKNTSDMEITDIRLTMTYVNRAREKGKNPKTAESSFVLHPWSGPLNSSNPGMEYDDNDNKKMSARAAAAISDYKNYVAEREKLRLAQLGEEQAVVDIRGNESDSDADNEGPEEVLPAPPLVRVVSMEPVGYSPDQNGGFLPIPAYSSVRFVLEFSFRGDLMLCEGLSADLPVTFNMSYLTADNSSFCTEEAHYYRNNKFDLILQPTLGISLVDVSLLCPGSCSSCSEIRLGNSEGNVVTDSGFVTDYAASENSGELDAGEAGVMDHLGNILAENKNMCPAVKVIGDDTYLVLKWRNFSSDSGVVYVVPPHKKEEEVPDTAIQIIMNDIAMRHEEYCFHEEDFFRVSDGNISAAPSVMISLPAHSSKNIYVKLNAALKNTTRSRKKSLLLDLRQKLKSLSWCQSSNDSFRRGVITQRFLSGDLLRKIINSLALPHVDFSSEGLSLNMQSSPLSSTVKKTCQLLMPCIDANRYVYSAILTSFKLPSMPLRLRSFYNFSVRARLSEIRGPQFMKRQLEVAVIVMEGHHVGLAQLGPGTGRSAKTRLGASYILPVISVDPLPAAAAAAVAIAASSSMQHDKSIAVVDVGNIEKRDSVNDSKAAERSSIPPQSQMICAGVLVSGQLRRVFDVHDSSAHDPVDHSVKLCFINSGKFTIYTLARELKYKNPMVSGVCHGEGRSSKPESSPWFLDSSPVLISVSGNYSPE